MSSDNPRHPVGAERERLRVLHDYGVLDTAEDPVFDDLTALAAHICGTPISLVSLVDEDRQWFKSHYGLRASETPRSMAFCAHVIKEASPLVVVPDARLDPRFAENALVTGEPFIRFYAASPLRTADGFALGTLCVIDRRPRELSPGQLEALQILARQAMSQLELRRTLRKLQRSEERFHSVARAVNDVIWEWDLTAYAHPESYGGTTQASGQRRSTLQGDIWWSEGFESAFGFSTAEKPATIEAWAEHVHPEDRERVLERLRHAVDTQATAWRDEYRFRRSDGTYAIVRDRGEILRDATGRAYRICGGMRDLTELRLLETQALRAQRLEGLGALAGGIAHDLNNVLTPVLMSADMLKNLLVDRPEEAQLADAIEKGARRGAELVRQIVSFARGAKGTYSRMAVRGVLLEAASLAMETFPRSIAVTTDLPSDLWLVRGNATHLHQVFMNVLVNARDAMPDGGKLTISAKNANLAQDECAPFKRKAGPYVIVSITDTGVGMTPEVQDRSFEPFFTTKAPGAGTGLGLSTVHGIVTGHQGFVRLFSTVGKGTTVQVCLPAEPEAMLAPVVAKPVPAFRGKGERILLVDDEAEIRDVAATMLKRSGYRVVTAQNGRDALGLFSAHPHEFDLVILDVMMPVMDGVTCLTEMTKIRPDLRVIVATGGLQPGFSRPLPAGIPVLPKPYVGESLLAVVRATLDRR